MFLSLLLFPVTINYLSPYIPVAGAADGIIAGSLIVFALLAITAIVFGRAFCGWFCPVGSVQDICMDSRTKRITSRWVNWIKYAIFIPWISLVIVLLTKAGKNLSVNLLYMIENGVSVDSPGGLIRFYMIALPIVALAYLFGRRVFCHSLCWIAPFLIVGSKLRTILHIPGPSLNLISDKCTSCKACVNVCPMSLDVRSMVKAKDMKNSECILCGKCADTCKSKVIGFGFNYK
jgi:polyferredoxin